MTRDEIAALRDGATPGPWLEKYGDVLTVKGLTVALVPPGCVKDARLIAAAHELADTAIAAMDREAALVAQLATARADALDEAADGLLVMEAKCRYNDSPIEANVLQRAAAGLRAKAQEERG